MPRGMYKTASKVRQRKRAAMGGGAKRTSAAAKRPTMARAKKASGYGAKKPTMARAKRRGVLGRAARRSRGRMKY